MNEIRWRQKVMARDNWKCVVCGNGGIITAHHKDGWHWCVERRFDLSNGVTLCRPHHVAFHSKYTTHNNTEAQFLEWRADPTNPSNIMAEVAAHG